MTRDALTWRALGTYVYLAAEATELKAAGALAAAVLDEVDAACSRFRPDSELSRLNTHPGQCVPISPLLRGALQVALEAAQETDGLLDPTIGAQVRAIGYDRTFSLVPAESAEAAHAPVPSGTWRDVQLTEEGVTIPPRTLIDLGATGKAFAADLVAAVLAVEVAGPCIVSVGGDLRVSGRTSAPFTVAIGHRADEPAQATITLHEGAVATSSRSARRWVRGGRQWHHIIDPRTGAPAEGPWQTVTAYGHTAVSANSASTTALILGTDALDWLSARDVAARLVDDEDRITTTPMWDTAFGDEAA